MKQLYFALLVILLPSCTQKVYQVEAVPLRPRPVDDLLEVQTRFSGDVFDYLIFEIDVTNHRGDTIYLTNSDVELQMVDVLNKESISLQALHPEVLHHDLDLAEVALKKEKKERAILTAVEVGLSVIALAVSPRGSVPVSDQALYAADVAIGIGEDSRIFKLAEGDIEAQRAYVDDWVLAEISIPPRESATWDLLFDRRLIEADANLSIDINGDEFSFPYEMKIIELRR